METCTKKNSFIDLIYKKARFLIILYLFFKNQFFRYYLPKALFKLKLKGRYSTRVIHGSKIYLDFQDEGISRDLLKDDNREYLSIKTMQQELGSGDIVVDIGANIGYYALLEARLVGDKGKVYAVEPVAHNLELLKKNIGLNNYKNMEVFQFAIGNENKTASMYISNKSNWSSMIKSELISGTIIEEKSVGMITLDKFLENKPWPDLIRMDVEGYEVEIIEGMTKFLKSNKPLKIFMEIHDSRNGKREEMLNILKKFGFQIKIAMHNPITPQILAQNEPKFIRRTFEFLDNKLGFFQPCYINLDIDELITELSKSKKDKWYKWNHVFFERK